MTNHHTYNHNPQVEKFPAINPNTLPANQDQVTDSLPIRRFTAPGFDARKTAIVDLQAINPSIQQPTESVRKPSWELVDEIKAKSEAHYAAKAQRRRNVASKALKAFGIKKSAK